MTNEGVDWTAEEITEAIDTWNNFSGFSGETCGKCSKTANVLQGPGWFCTCGYFNAQSWNYSQPCHQDPDLGPSFSVIATGVQNSKKGKA